MKTRQTKDGRPEVVLEPGDYHAAVSKSNIIISTVLGSCVSACLYDPVNSIIGMNHFLLSNRRYKKDGPLVTTDAGRYGIHAMELLINKMIRLGASRKYIKAKAFGGGSIIVGKKEESNFFCVGEVNSRFIVEFLENEKIPLVSSDLGGISGRTLRFYSNDYSAYVRKLQSLEANSVVERDQYFWSKKVEEVEVKSTEIDLW